MTLLSNLLQQMAENIPAIVRASGTSITLAATNSGQQTRVTIGAKSYNVPSLLTLATGSVGANGLDAGSLAAGELWYVYAIVQNSTNAVALIASKTAPTSGPTMPSGYATGVYRVVGRFLTSSVVDVSHVVPLGTSLIEYLSNSSATSSSDNTSFIYGTDGSAGVMGVTILTGAITKTVRSIVAIQKSDLITVAFKGGSGIWMPLVSASFDSGIIPVSYQGTKTYGYGLSSGAVSSTDIGVVFGQYMYPSNASTYSAAGADWTNSGVIGAKWRIEKLSPLDILR